MLVAPVLFSDGKELLDLALCSQYADLFRSAANCYKQLEGQCVQYQVFSAI